MRQHVKKAVGPILSTLSILLILSLLNCPQAVADDSSVDAAAVKKWLEENKEFVILDVRTDSEFEEDHPEDAVNIPLYTKGADSARKLNENFVDDVKAQFNTDQTIVVICRTGGRSVRAAKMLRDAGFSNAYNFSNGFLGQGGWKSNGLPSTGDAKPIKKDKQKKDKAGKKPTEGQ
jgi:rhodanese-related sulfurtransferase